MKKVLIFIFIIHGLSSVSAQVLIDSIKIAGHSTYFYDGIENGSTFYTSLFKINPAGRYLNNINIYDQSLNLIDSIDGNQTGRTSLDVAVFGFFKFNQKTFVYARDPQFNVNIYRVVGNSLMDSTKLNIDTIYRSLPAHTEQIDVNRLRVILYEWDLNNQYIVQSKVVDLDSNFNVIDYHAFDFSQTNLDIRAQSQVITGIFDVGSNIWHIHTSRALHIYNTQTHTIDSSRYLWGSARAFHRLNPNEYLAMGTVSFSQPLPGFPYTGMNALGFYRMKNDGTPVDTTHFLNIDNITPGTLDFSHEQMTARAVVVYDTNTIYLGCSSTYQKNSFTDQEDYFFVVKTDSRGNEKWRYRWGGMYKPNLFNDLIPTPDKGCILIGAYPYDFPRIDSNVAILIKLGPDGNISNVELDAPETVVNFYPNPVKDKLHYSFLPDTKGPYTLEIMDMQGKPVLEKALDNEKGFVPVNLHSGFYLYHLKNKEGKVQQVGKLFAE